MVSFLIKNTEIVFKVKGQGRMLPRPNRSTRSSTLVILLQPSVDFSLKITDRSFRCAAHHLWNKLPPALRVPYQFDPSSSPSFFSIVILSSWTACWPFSWRFSLSS